MGCSGCAGKPVEPAKRVVVLGLDAGTWDLLDPYMERGLLPNLARLRDTGSRAPLKSIEPSSSPVIWTTVATGKMPEKHGITFFVRFPDGKTGDPEPVTSNMRKGKAIWGMLGTRGFDVAIDGWFVTWPIEPYGRMISDRAHWGAIDGRGAFPPGYVSYLKTPTIEESVQALPHFVDESAIADFKYDPENTSLEGADEKTKLNYLIFDRLVKAYQRDTYYLLAAERLLTDGPLPHFFAIYLRGTDDVQHGFWKFMEPKLFPDVTPEQAEAFGKVIERYWQWIDTSIGILLKHYKNTPTFVLAISDHGAGPAVGEYKVTTPEYLHLSGSHRDTGFLIANGPGVTAGGRLDTASVLDITPTILWYMGQPVADDMDGKPLTGLFDAGFAKRPIEHIATYDDEQDAATPHIASPVDEKALEHLRSLGYIDGPSD